MDSTLRRRLHERLLFIVCSQNWETIGPHFWIKQCIELVLGTAVANAPLRSGQTVTLLPAATAGLQSLEDLATTCPTTALKEEPTDTEEEIDIELPSATVGEERSLLEGAGTSNGAGRARQNLQQLVQRQGRFLEGVRELRLGAFLSATVQLCHLDTPLAQHLWLQLMPRLWKVLNDRQQSYLGRSHNLWHRACLLLEQAALAGRGGGAGACASSGVGASVRGGVPEEAGAAEDALAELYSLLREEDLLGGLWQRRARHPETPLALALEQQGCFEQAQAALEAAMARVPRHESASTLLQSECRLWEEHWLRCCKELNQWELVLEYGKSKSAANPHLVLESAWRVPDWPLMKEALSQVELSCPKEQAWRVNLYRGYIAICHPDEQHLSLVERVVEVITGQCIREWRRLPHIVSHVHVPLLQGLDVIESTNLKYFAKDMTAEFYALKGLFLAQMGRSEEANKALSAAVQMHDTLVKAWALWGDYLEGLFGRDRWESRQLNLAASALTCFLHACRHQNEPKARKYLAK
ncbi:hypothetical protein V5799_009909, partial [Amblyomma americanum]